MGRVILTCIDYDFDKFWYPKTSQRGDLSPQGMRGDTNPGPRLTLSFMVPQKETSLGAISNLQQIFWPDASEESLEVIIWSSGFFLAYKETIQLLKWVCDVWKMYQIFSGLNIQQI